MNKKSQQQTIVDWEYVIVDTRDKSLDVKLPKKTILERYCLGHLVFDCMNGQYAVPENGKVPGWMVEELESVRITD